MTIMLGALSVVGLAMFPRWRTEVDDGGSTIDIKPFPSKTLIRLCTSGTALAAFFCLLAVMWQHVAALSFTNTIETMTQATIKGTIGAAVMALGWTAVLFLANACCGNVTFTLEFRLPGAYY